LEIQSLDVPRPEADEVLLRVSTNGICGSDMSGYIGQNSLRVPPLIMGHEFSGRIAEIGSGAPKLYDTTSAEVGQHVVVNPLLWCGTCDLCLLGRQNLCRHRRIIGIHRPGGLAEYVAVPASACHLIPPGLTDLHAALTEPLSCGIRAVAQTGVKPEDTLLILGAGSIGLLCLVAARGAGLSRILITDTSAGRLEIARELGAAETIDASRGDVLGEVHRLTDGLGAVAVIDAVGVDSTREQAVRGVRPGGRAVLMGLHHETSELAANYVVRQEVEVVGAFSYLPHEFCRALTMLAEGAIPNVEHWVVERDIVDGAAVFQRLVSGQAEAVKIALKP
jgi:threonine dehydrogenase-like Zn-dependent dehydrogenase